MCPMVLFIASSTNILNKGYLLFTSLDLITGDITVHLVPNFFNGAWPGALEKRVRDDLNKILMLTRKLAVFIAPNFFLKLKV